MKGHEKWVRYIHGFHAVRYSCLDARCDHEGPLTSRLQASRYSTALDKEIHADFIVLRITTPNGTRLAVMRGPYRQGRETFGALRGFAQADATDVVGSSPEVQSPRSDKI